MDARPTVIEREPDYRDWEPLTLATVPPRLAAIPAVAERLGGAPGDWAVREVGDGNINYVYIVEGPAGSVCVKQALHSLRIVESWKLPLSRSFYEHAALTRHARRSGHVPEVLHFEPEQAFIVMENLGRHVIWRKALIARQRHETAPVVLGRFLAETLFRSSDLSLSAAEKKREMALFAGNTALHKITEDLVFTDPYRDDPMNRWTPALEPTVRAVQADTAWKIAIQDLKFAFLTRAEALLHGDAHTGSVMVAADPEDVRVIDPEFAMVGPMGFDVGAILANLWLSYFSQDGHGPGGEGMQAWLLDATGRLWDTFAARFAELWRTERTGDAYPATLYDEAGSEAALSAFLARLEVDALGFAGAKMTRRIIGLAKVADLETIADEAVKVRCERRALALARMLVVERQALGTVKAASEAARHIRGVVS
jgi:5-methylthioribose kinase